AEVVINSRNENAADVVMQITGGAHISIDALGHPEILLNSISSLRKRGKHIQVGIMEAGKHNAPVPVDKIVARELEIIGSHGMQAHRYPEMLEMIRRGQFSPKMLIGRTLKLSDGISELANMNGFGAKGVIVINSF
ncbi:MAG: zinc-binding dehydrogenase, partial [Pyrinomonadaceae bacterium]